MKFGRAIYDPLRMNYNDFGNPLQFKQALPGEKEKKEKTSICPLVWFSFPLDLLQISKA